MQWTEQAIKLSLDGTFTKVLHSGKIKTFHTLTKTQLRNMQRQALTAAPKRKSRTPWSLEDDRQIIDLRASGMTQGDIAVILGRTSASIGNRLYKLTAEA